MPDILKQTDTTFTCIGYVDEKALKRETVDIDVGPKDNKKKTRTECIKGRVAINIGTGVVTFPIYATKINYSGNDNFFWPMAEAMMDEWEPRAQDKVNGTGTKVIITGDINPNDYFNQKGELKYDLRYRVNTARTRGADALDCGMNLIINAYVNKVTHEIKDDEETGRLIVEFMGVTYDGKCYPIKAYVDAEAADVIENGSGEYEGIEVGQTRTNISLEYVFTTPTVVKNKGFSVRRASVDAHKTARAESELVLCELDMTPVEEPDEKFIEDENGNVLEVPTLWIDPKVMKKAILERAKMLEEKKARGPEKKAAPKQGGNKLEAQKAQLRANPVPHEYSPDDNPYGF